MNDLLKVEVSSYCRTIAQLCDRRKLNGLDLSPKGASFFPKFAVISAAKAFIGAT